MDNEGKWSQRRIRHLDKQYGIKTEIVADRLRVGSRTDALSCAADGGIGEPSRRSNAALPMRIRSLDRQHARNDIIEHRESVFQMACNGLNSLIHGDVFRRRWPHRSATDRRMGDRKVPTYVSVRDRDRHFVGNCSFPSAHRYARQDSYWTVYGATPGAATIAETPFTTTAAPSTTTPNDRFYLPRHSSADEMELDDEAAYDILYFDEDQSCGAPTPSVGQRSTGVRDTTPGPHRVGHVTIEQPPKASKLHRFLNFFGCGGDEDTASRLRSLVKFKFSTRRDARHSHSLPMGGRFRSDPELVRQLKDESCDYRPYFTYWISTVHIMVTLFMLITYGIGTDYTNGLGVIERSGDVMTSSLSSAHIVVWEQHNVWIGPRFADLVHVGAKFTPCMRRDNKIYEQILEERRTEAETTGCCIGPGGCFQTSVCPKQFATLIKWANETVLPESVSSSSSRVVCGQDPRYCLKPRVHPMLWGNNISRWPICEEHSASIPKSVKHMHCEVTGHPCCIQMHGQCRITSREYCDFVRGYYHPNATLCSQVSCLNEVCGMTSFWIRDHPDQLYRLITPLFIHAGIIRCLLSLAIYLTIMRRFEIMIGWLRLSSIYFVSGIGGYLASAVFVPYMPEVGPAGSEGGVLGALIINILYNWSLLRHPLHALSYHLAIAMFLFILGFLPYIDNWAQLFGFLFGSLMATVVIPYFTFGSEKRNKRFVVVFGASVIMALLFSFLLILFFFYPLNYEVLGLFNCPWTGKVCDHHGLILRNWLPI